MSDPNVSPAGLRLVRILAGRPPQPVGELVRAMGVTRTAEQLDELVSLGYVERSVQRSSGRGRPRHLYRTTDAALLALFPGNQRLLAPALWRAIFEEGGDALARRIVERVGRAMADYYNARITARRPRDRLRQLIELLSAEGALADAEEDRKGRWTFSRRSCPFISMADERRNVCLIDLKMLSAVVGRPVRRAACRQDGDPCCAFEIDD